MVFRNNVRYFYSKNRDVDSENIRHAVMDTAIDCYEQFLRTLVSLRDALLVEQQPRLSPSSIAVPNETADNRPKRTRRGSKTGQVVEAIERILADGPCHRSDIADRVSGLPALATVTNVDARVGTLLSRFRDRFEPAGKGFWRLREQKINQTREAAMRRQK